MKKFLVIGNMNAVTYKEVFHLIKENKMWLGIPFAAGNAYFYVDNVKAYATGVYDETKGLVKFRNCHWFTNLKHNKRHEKIDLYKHYSPDEYPKYDNYDAIEVSKVRNIPMDYDGVIGVPITFLDKFCPEQFEILWTTDRGGDGMLEDIKVLSFDKSWDSAWVNGNKVYKRIFIRIKK